MVMSIMRSCYIALWFLILLAGLSGADARAQTQGIMTAIRLQQLCDSPYDVDAGMCAGYVMSVAEMIIQDPRPSRRVCLSPAVGPQMLVQNLQQEWKDNPPQAYALAIENVETSLRHRFKCL